ncbi:hypothetical protein E4U56_004388 [Claviceps arundinis]|uniref:Uncharacterized protein n=1 Tax=Claviceps arundinis TaxID=1623583 RepID=A0A9P7MN71_9HYPO|nr:hypothetical protein E4U56_004388 [Claviceps arundinis]
MHFNVDISAEEYRLRSTAVIRSRLSASGVAQCRRLVDVRLVDVRLVDVRLVDVRLVDVRLVDVGPSDVSLQRHRQRDDL